MKSFTLATLTADDDAIKTAFSVTGDSATYSGDDLNGVLGQLTLNPARLLTVKDTSVTGAYEVGSKISVHGDNDEDFLLTDADGGETRIGDSAFGTITSIVAEPQVNTDGSFKVGVQADPADTDAIKVSIASSNLPAAYSGADWDGVIGPNPIVPSRRITASVASNAGSYTAGSKITFVGMDSDSNVLNEFVTIVGTDGDESFTTVGYFHTLISINIEAQADTSGAFEFGVASDAADDDAIITSFSAVDGTLHSFSGDDLDGVIAGDTMTPARTITVKTTAVTGAYVVDSVITVTGRDASGSSVSEDFTIGDVDGGETLVGDVGFTAVLSIDVEPQALSGAEFKIGVRDYSFSDPPLGLRFGATGDIKVGYATGVVDTIATLIIGEHLPIRAKRIFCTSDTTTSKVTAVF